MAQRLAARRKLIAAVALPAVALIAILWAATWYVSGEVASGGLNPRHDPPAIEVEIVEVSPDQIILRRVSGDDWQKPGAWGLSWQGGFGRVGAIVSIDRGEDASVREWTPLLGGDPPPGTGAAMDSVPYPVDPLVAHGLAFQTVRYPSELGPMPAWLIPAGRATWVIEVHGKSAERESLLIAPLVHSLDLPLLGASYRNDRDAPASPLGRFAYGASEWRDVEAAVRYALDAGAQDVVLVGTSMGGGIVLSFLYESPLAEHVRGVVLDAPMLHLDRVFAAGLVDSGIPGFATGFVLWVAEARYGVDIPAADYLSRADELAVPVLLIHGTADQTVPVELSDELAAARPDLVRYLRLDGVTHARAFQERPDLVAPALRAFLEALLVAE